MKGDRYRNVRSKTGRVWIEDDPTHSNLVRLHPLGDDVRPAQTDGRMNGGVRSIEVATEHLADRRRWEAIDD